MLHVILFIYLGKVNFTFLELVFDTPLQFGLEVTFDKHMT